MVITLITTNKGLSPRVRGNRDCQPYRWCCRRSIPARAGEPRQPSAGGGASRVYPRACGGTIATATTFTNVKGLSPRVRGNLERTAKIPARFRSIPARAGEPAVPAYCRRIPPVYPRACGGTERGISFYRFNNGLSPRVRGNPTRPATPSSPGGSIPARAGEPAGRSDAPRHRGVYPRACGGTKDSDELTWIYAKGLSPRVRGNLAATAKGQGHRVYPRACGGTVYKYPQSFYAVGLSPRVRGNRILVRYYHNNLRSIPARAGEPR